MRLKDIDQVLALERKTWSEGLRATREMLEIRIRMFPLGNLCAVVAGEVVGVVATQIICASRWPGDFSWNEITDGGWIRSTHDSTGDTLYGVNLSVLPTERGDVACSLMEATGKLVIRCGLRWGMLGARIPSYHKHADGMSAAEYVSRTTKSGRPLDPELAFYQRLGLKIIRVLPDYIADEGSKNYGVLLAFENPFWKWSQRLPFLARPLSELFRVK